MQSLRASQIDFLNAAMDFVLWLMASSGAAEKT
jgi:hypothetical protein